MNMSTKNAVTAIDVWIALGSIDHQTAEYCTELVWFAKKVKVKDICITGGDNMSFYAKCPREVHEILGIKVEPGIEQQLLENLRKFPEVAAAFISLGEYDIIALLGIEDPDELARFVVENVRKTKGVQDTRTTVVERVRAVGPRTH
jgi:DNA-binding Lrp family transcriptional regulator